MSRWLNKPPSGVQLNLGGDFARGLRHCYPLNANGGRSVFNLAYPGTLAATAGVSKEAALGTATAWAPGRGLSFDGTSNSYVDLGDDDAMNGACTVMVRASLNAIGALRALAGDNNSGGSEKICTAYVFSTGNFRLYVNNGLAVSGSKTLSANTSYTIAWTIAGAAAPFSYTTYIDGLQDGTGSASPAVTTDPLRIGRPGANTGSGWLGHVDFFYLWNRVLSTSEINEYTRYPYAGFYKPVRRTYFIAAAAGGGGTLPTGGLLLMGCGR